MGGRALLRRLGSEWRLILCGGDTLKEAKLLQQFGLNAGEAESLVKAIVDAETQLDPALVAKFSTFDGIVMIKRAAIICRLAAWTRRKEEKLIDPHHRRRCGCLCRINELHDRMAKMNVDIFLEKGCRQ